MRGDSKILFASSQPVQLPTPTAALKPWCSRPSSMSRLLDLATGAALGALGLALIVTLNERLEEETRRLWRRGLLAASRAARSTLT